MVLEPGGLVRLTPKKTHHRRMRRSKQSARYEKEKKEEVVQKYQRKKKRKGRGEWLLNSQVQKVIQEIIDSQALLRGHV